MEHIWSPWRYRYIASADQETGCLFCRVNQPPLSDRENLVLFRGDYSFVILNRYPYTSGHLMISPYEHTASLSQLNRDTTVEIMELAKQAESALTHEYKPDGFNIGLNLGRSAGAGVADHIHMHVVARWTGDANFVSIIGETRILPEELTTTYDRLQSHFTAKASPT